MISTGVSWYVGCPASGKTTLARAHAIAAANRNGYPVLVIDTESVLQLRGFPAVRSAAAAIRAVWTDRRSVSWSPGSAEELESVLRAVHRPGRVNLVVDEAHVWLSARSAGSAPLLRIMRAHRHSKVCLFLTTQHLSGDVPQAALACSPRLFLFRCTSPATLERLERTYGIEPQLVKNLAQFQYLRHFEGFS